MPEEKNKGGEGEEVTTPQADQFGVTLNSDGTEVSQEETITKEEEGKKETDEEKKKKDDIENHPAVVALKTKIEEYGNNLAGQRTAHEREVAELKTQLAEALKNGGKKDGDGEVEPMFKDIKFSKDLPKEELDDMTDAEIRLFDQNAEQRVAMNKMFAEITKSGKTAETAVKTVEEQKVEDLNTSARTEASRLAEEAIKANPALAKDAKELTDKIIVEFNEFNNTGLTPEKLVERMQKALNNVHGYTPPKEQEKKGGNKPVTDQAKGADPFGIDKIVSSVNKGNDGNYNL